jgi:Protein of unknown function (DUF3047)
MEPFQFKGNAMSNARFLLSKIFPRSPVMPVPRNERAMSARYLFCLLMACIVLQSGCAHTPPGTGRPPSTQVTPFSSAKPGGPFPGGWRELRFAKFRAPTRFELFDDSGATVVHATSENSSSVLMENLDLDPRQYPVLRWKWNAPRLVPGANTTRRKKEDAPVRLIVAFDGNKDKLSFSDQMTFAETRALLGLDPPYATLEYVWGDGAPKETIVENGWNARIRLLLAQSGAERIGEWVPEMRNIVEDFRRAFGEEPGRITSIGIHCDSDATETRSEGYFGDIEFLRGDEKDKSGDLRKTGQ